MKIRQKIPFRHDQLFVIVLLLVAMAAIFVADTVTDYAIAAAVGPLLCPSGARRARPRHCPAAEQTSQTDHPLVAAQLAVAAAARGK